MHVKRCISVVFSLVLCGFTGIGRILEAKTFGTGSRTHIQAESMISEQTELRIVRFWREDDLNDNFAQ